jgi:hypothetical protein
VRRIPFDAQAADNACLCVPRKWAYPPDSYQWPPCVVCFGNKSSAEWGCAMNKDAWQEHMQPVSNQISKLVVEIALAALSMSKVWSLYLRLVLSEGGCCVNEN